MNTKLKLFVLLAMLFIGQKLFAQTNAESAKQKAIEAIKLEDVEGNYDAAIKLLEEAQNLDPDNIVYPYELAYAYSGKKEYEKAKNILEKLLQRKDVSALVYQALGNAYDFLEKPNKAISCYEDGLKKFPNSGELYLELGNMQFLKKDLDRAIVYYEKGIEVDPMFPSNYYWATKIFCNSTEEVWGMIYGEIFMNLERSSKRTFEISKLLFDTYKSEISFTSDTSMNVSFSKNSAINVSNLNDIKNFKLPFGVGCYEPLMLISIFKEKQIDLNSLDRIRTNFLINYFTNNYNKTYPNILFEFQQKIKNSGHFEAYNHWLMMKGDEDNFIKWREHNKAKWNDFAKWFTDNWLILDNTNKFFRGQY